MCKATFDTTFGPFRTGAGLGRVQGELRWHVTGGLASCIRHARLEGVRRRIHQEVRETAREPSQGPLYVKQSSLLDAKHGRNDLVLKQIFIVKLGEIVCRSMKAARRMGINYADPLTSTKNDCGRPKEHDGGF